MKEDIYDVISIKTDADKQTLKGFIDEAVRCKEKIKMESEAIKDIRNEAKDRLNIPPKIFNKMVKSVLHQDLGKERQEFEEFEALMETIYKTSN